MSAPLYCPALLFPPVSWWRAIVRSGRDNVTLCTGAGLHFMGYANRYTIATASGAQTLYIPVVGGRKKAETIPLNEVRIDYSHGWRHKHWGALYSAYGRAPFFEHYSPGLKALLDADFNCLATLNVAAIQWLADAMRVAYRFHTAITNKVSGGNEEAVFLQFAEQGLTTYHQVFGARHGFIEDCSAIDLLMNEGTAAVRFLKEELNL